MKLNWRKFEWITKPNPPRQQDLNYIYLWPLPVTIVLGSGLSLYFLSEIGLVVVLLSCTLFSAYDLVEWMKYELQIPVNNDGSYYLFFKLQRSVKPLLSITSLIGTLAVALMFLRRVFLFYLVLDYVIFFSGLTTGIFLSTQILLHGYSKNESGKVED